MVIYINNKRYKLKKKLRWNILNMCNSLNIQVPVFCYHEKLNVAGNCRMCLVEVEKAPKPIVACATPLMDKMVIFTKSPLVKKARENVLELLLLNHPLDCPICDQGGECDLQDNTQEFSSELNRNLSIFKSPSTNNQKNIFGYLRRGVEDKNLGCVIKTIMTRCIHCTRCVRFIDEIANIEGLKALGRGSSMEISTYINKILKHELSGNLVDICPVGALTSAHFAFKARPWELKRIKTLNFTEVTGSFMIAFIRLVSNENLNKDNSNQIIRVTPSLNENSSDNWITDKARFSFDGLYKNRIYNLNTLIKKKLNYKKIPQFSWATYFSYKNI